MATKTETNTLEVLTTDQSRALLSVSYPTFWRLSKTEDFPKPIYVTRRPLFVKAELIAWFLKHRANKPTRVMEGLHE